MPKSNPSVVNKAKYEAADYSYVCEECLRRLNADDADFDPAAYVPHGAMPDTHCVECAAFAAGVHPDGPKRRPLEAFELDHILTGLELFREMLSSGSEEDKVLKRELRALGERLKRAHVTLETLE